jgi:hypothetical protein
VKKRKDSPGLRGKRRPLSGKAALPALVAAGGGLAAGSAAALELGELQLQSALGQPLRASVAYALSANEIIQDACVTVRSGGRDLPGLHNASVRVSKGVISIAGRSPVTEPILSATVVIDCPYSAHVSRSYLMLVNPEVRTAVATHTAPAVATVAVASRAAASRPARATTPVSPDSRYLVQRGDSLSAIVQRLEARSVAAADAMAAILEANPQAFINGDPDRLKAGSWLDIPSLAGSSIAATMPDAPAAPDTPAEPNVDASSVSPQTTADAGAYAGAENLEPDASRQVPATEFLPEVAEAGLTESIEAPAGSAAGEVADDTAAEDDYSAAYADLVPGEVVVDEPAATDTVTAEPAAAKARVVTPAAGNRIVGSPEPAGSSWNWLIWTAAALISAFGAYLMFWPRLRERFGSKPVGPQEHARGTSEHSVPHIAPISVPESEMTVQEIKPTYDNVDFDLSDDSPTEENLALDADLIDGTGFDDAGDADVNRDFGFAATMDLDMELPEVATAEDSMPETDIIPPPERPDEHLVVSSKVLPGGDDDEYDISVIVDATKMPDPADVTEHDLKAVPIDDTGQTLINDDYTIVDELGQDILEQDYEDEFSATQLLSAEIDKAAAELADSIGNGDAGVEATTSGESDDGGRFVGPSDDTSIEMQLTNLSELDLTATLEAQNDEMEDDLDVTANIKAEDKTIEMPRDTDGARAR